MLKEVYLGRKQPFPTQMKLEDSHKVRVFDSAYVYSYYRTLEMNSRFETGGTNRLIKFTQMHGSQKKNQGVKYGKYSNVEPLKFEEIFIHFSYESPLPRFSKVERTFTVSHWGYINVDESYELVNDAAKLTGEFGRIDYNPMRVRYSINQLSSKLPKKAKYLYYTDLIGNISTSNAYRGSSEVSFDIVPRFPIMGGWRTTWFQGYTLPTKSCIDKHSKEDLYYYTTKFSHPYDDIAAEEFIVNIILPEGAELKRAFVEVEGADIELLDELKFLYLDF